MAKLIALIFAAASLAACAGEGADPTDGAADGSAVSIVDFAYQPATLTVSSEQLVTWTNNGAVPHTVTFDEGPDSGALNPGETFDQAFGAAGEYEYRCTIHPQMRGVLNVGP